MISHRGISVITPLPFGEGKGEGPAGEGGGASIFLAFVCSGLLCKSVRKRTHPLYEMTHKQHAGEVFLSRWGGLSLTELTELTEPFCAQFRAHRTPPAYRVHRALLLKKGVE